MKLLWQLHLLYLLISEAAAAFFLAASVAALLDVEGLLRFADEDLVPESVKVDLPGFRGLMLGRPKPGTEIPQCLAKTS